MSRPSIPPEVQRGAAAVEFALVCMMLFTFVFAALEVARALYLWSTVAEVVNRAARLAAVSSPQDLAAVKLKAMSIGGTSQLPLGGGIDPSYLRIDYLACDNTPVAEPLPTPIGNVVNCTASPTDKTCIRFVRVRLCQPGTDCAQVPYTPMVGLPALTVFNMVLPTFTTVVAADSLGLTPSGQ